MVGNYIADGVKGDPYKRLPREIALGVKMHRAIDHFMDNHYVTAVGKQRLYPAYGKYAAVIIDIYYDHLLARNWAEYSNIPLGDFSQHCYNVLSKYQEVFPEKSKRFYFYMVREDILSRYAYMDGIQQALSGMAQRTRFKSNMEKATQELKLYLKEYEAEFNVFFPEIINYIDENYK